MKRDVIEPQRVTFADGTVKVVCCGPAVLRDGRRVVAYMPAGPSSYGRCCHR